MEHTNLEFAAGLRAAAEYYEAHPDAPLPYSRLLITAYGRQEFFQAAQIIGRGGMITYSADPVPAIYPRARASRDFGGGVTVEVTVDRATIAELVRPAEYSLPPEFTPEVVA